MVSRYEYDATDEQWLMGDPGVMSGSVAAADQRYAKSTPVREGRSPRLSLMEWLLISPLVFGLGFIMGVYWP